MRIALVLAVFVAGAYAALPLNEYLPPLEDASPVNNQDLQSLTEQSSPLADDGYRYKTVRRYRLRHRRDVNELPSNDYLPPVSGAASNTNNFVADLPVAIDTVGAAEASQDSAVLADDGYRYKTVKRYRYRHRRDVNELPSNEYLPPVAEAQSVQYAEAPVAVAQETAALADDGYRYKTVRRVVHRRRF